MKKFSRRDFIKTIACGSAGLGVGNLISCSGLTSARNNARPETKEIVSVVKIRKDNVEYAVRQALDLLGGITAITIGKERIMLKPNLVNPEPQNATNIEVVRALALLMKEAGKDVLIGEGSAIAGPNSRPGCGSACRTRDKKSLDTLQQMVFDRLGYSELEKRIKALLVNLHTGEMVKVRIPQGFVFEDISLHHSLTDIDMLCSVPMMKTHGLAGVTLGIKNLMGLYPGQVYGTVRSAVHSEAAKVEDSGTASAIVDMLRANKIGLVVIDASVAMQGQGPLVCLGGRLVKMDLIIAGTNPLATDMVAASIMGFHPREISTFAWAWKAGMTPISLNEIEIRGVEISAVQQNFIRPNIFPWHAASEYGPPC